jgi:cyclopropane-fatty-acyl-phospholipid synthase
MSTWASGRPSFARARVGAFNGGYVFPDGELEAVGTIISAIQDNGFEVRHEENFREHYSRTCAAWGQPRGALGRSAARGRRRTGPGMAAESGGLPGRLTELGMELHQVLATKTVRSDSGMPLVRSDFTGHRRSKGQGRERPCAPTKRALTW